MENSNTNLSPTSQASQPTRRKFLAGVGATAAGLGYLPISASANVAGSDRIKVGLVGTGGRGSGAVLQNLKANPAAQLVAAGDAFESRLKGNGPRKSGGLQLIEQQIKQQKLESQIDLPAERQFTGFNAYQEVIENCDLVILATTPGFRPLHFEAAVAAGKHVFMEKPVCIDAHGYNRVIRSAQQADEKNLKVVVGLQRHYQEVYLQAFEKVHSENLIGDIISAQCYWNGARPWVVARDPSWSELEYQMHNWYHFNYLCGDHICEQHVHNLDVVNWFMTGDSERGGHPVNAQGMGGRTGWEDPKTSEIFDHHYVEYRYGNGKILNSQCRQVRGTKSRVGEEIHGSKGILSLEKGEIKDFSGKTLWRYRAPRDGATNPFQVEHDHLHAAIKDGSKLNNAYYGADSSFTAVLGRLATYTGQQVSWDEAVKSDYSLLPDDLDWDKPAPVQPQADGTYKSPMPGVTKLPWA
ncbi:MAG: Gfo/Idh/MocA family protein [Roseibacillus sp.]